MESHFLHILNPQIQRSRALRVLQVLNVRCALCKTQDNICICRLVIRRKKNRMNSLREYLDCGRFVRKNYWTASQSRIYVLNHSHSTWHCPVFHFRSKTLQLTWKCVYDGLSLSKVILKLSKSFGTWGYLGERRAHQLLIRQILGSKSRSATIFYFWCFPEAGSLNGRQSYIVFQRRTLNDGLFTICSTKIGQFWNLLIPGSVENYNNIAVYR